MKKLEIGKIKKIVRSVYLFGFICIVILIGLAGLLVWQKYENKLMMANIKKEILVSQDNQGKTANAYKAIVQVKTIVQDKEYSLYEAFGGSGVIINSQGLILTNWHVVTAVPGDSFEKEPKPDEAGYQICLTEDFEKEPDCSYVAKLVERDKDLDLALLQIETIPSFSSKKEFKYLEINTADNTKLGDEIIALGYPEIGNESITFTKGVVSGKLSKYKKNWIKTDAVVSFGNSGGAAIDKNGRVVGVTSEAYSDLKSSLGYIINVTSINDWLHANQNKKSQDISFYDRLVDLTKKQKILKTGNTFINYNPNISLTKPVDWRFNYIDESTIKMDKEDDDDSGYVSIAWYKQPYFFDLNNIAPFLKYFSYFSLSYGDYFSPEIIEDETVKIDNQPAKKIVYLDKGDKQKNYLIPYRNYLIQVFYGYGKDDKDKEVIDKIINSLKIKNSNEPFNEIKEYKNNIPFFNLKVSDGWTILNYDDDKKPLIALNKNFKNVYCDINVEKADEENKDFDNQEYLDSWKTRLDDFNEYGDFDFRIEIIESNPNVKINKEIDGAIKVKIVIKDNEDDKILGRGLGYFKKVDDKYIIFSCNLYNDNKKQFSQLEKEFSKMLEGFSLKN